MNALGKCRTTLTREAWMVAVGVRMLMLTREPETPPIAGPNRNWAWAVAGRAVTNASDNQPDDAFMTTVPFRPPRTGGRRANGIELRTEWRRFPPPSVPSPDP
jgi:hypothetical protein